MVNHPPPDLTVQPVAAELTGCIPDEYGNQVCSEDSPAGQLGCDHLSPVGEYLGALDPARPLSLCWVTGAGGEFLESTEYIYRDGCRLPQFARYLTEQDGNLALLGTLADLGEAYSPIISEDEAFSYAIAATGLAAYFNFVPPEGFRYFVGQMEDSHVRTDGSTYQVYLYDYQLCGCGPHTTSYVEVSVNPDGSFAETGRVPVFEDPEQDSLCVD